MDYSNLYPQDPKSKRQRALKRMSALKTERSGWEGRWRTISQHVLPFNGRFFADDRNRGNNSFNKILDSEATFSLSILAAGMMSGMTSPARPWFRLQTPDPELNEQEDVKLWLNDVTQLMRDIFNKGNTYRMLHSLYEELGAFATAGNIILSDFEHVIWHTPLTIGQYYLATDARDRVNTLYRQYQLTVQQVVEEFLVKPNGSIDWALASERIKSAWDNHNYEVPVEILHVIEPRRLFERDLTRRSLPKNMAFKSCYFELGKEGEMNEKGYLRESGFKDFPAVTPRWHTRGEDVYGNGPGHVAIGHIKQLQQQQRRKGQAIDHLSYPAINLPADMKSRELDTLPGGVNYFASTGQAGRGNNLFDVKLSLSEMLADIQDVRRQINRAFYADLFLMLANDTRQTPPTAREVAERHEEKLLMLGPVLERLHDELLSPLVDTTFTKMVEAGIVPEPPEALQGTDLKIEYVSTLAQAQRAVGLGSLDRLIGTVGALGQGSGDLTVWDKLDKDQIVDKYADMLGVDPSIIVADNKIAIIRQQRQEAQAQQAQLAAAPEVAAANKSQAEAEAIAAETGGPPETALSPFTGYS